MASGNDKEIKIGISAETSGADEAKRALEGVRAAAEGAAAATAGVNSNATASGGESGGGEAAEAVEEANAAIDDQLEMLAELKDLEFGVVDLRKKDVQAILGVIEQQKKLNDETKKAAAIDGVFSPQRMAEAKKELGKLGEAVADFAREFAKTEEGQRMLEGLSDETKTFGSVALKVAGSVAEGFAAGGPIGGALAGITSVVQQVAGEYLDAQKRIEESNRQLAIAEAEALARREAKYKAAATRDVEDQLRRENDELDDQNEALRENEQLMKSRRDVAKAEFDLKQAQDEAKGKSREQLDAERVRFEFQEKNKELNQRRDDREKESRIKEQAANDAEVAADDLKKINGPNDSKYKAAAVEARRAREAADDDKRQRPKDLEGIENERKAAGFHATAELTRISTRAGKEREREAQREKDQKQRDKEKAEREAQQQEREKEREVDRRQGIGRSLENVADKAFGMSKDSAQAQARFEKVGNDLAKDPTAGGIAELTSLLGYLEKHLGKDGDRAKAVRDLQEEVRKLKGQLTKGGDIKHQ